MQEAVNQSVSKNYIQPVNLSDREREILKLIVEGQTNQEIASHLYLSLSTVKTHVKSIFNKMGVDHRVQAAVAALRLKLI
ncbi:helix-turn-helix transcriptional regulator [filamentous cyanobacterium CCP1]|nr:helix-turn-helix transcriptional regulator [filamentous cyanobacterium CCP2]PSB67712.1 helix-turn-helix transcriptional regulator [filamentous cyanobacterium CCP1]